VPEHGGPAPGKIISGPRHGCSLSCCRAALLRRRISTTDERKQGYGAGSPDRDVGSLSVRHVQRSVPAPASRSRRIVINAACQRLLCARRYDSKRAVGNHLQKGIGSLHGHGTARAATRAGSLHRDSSRLRVRVFLDGNFEHAVAAGRIDVLRIGALGGCFPGRNQPRVPQGVEITLDNAVLTSHGSHRTPSKVLMPISRVRGNSRTPPYEAPCSEDALGFQEVRKGNLANLAVRARPSIPRRWRRYWMRVYAWSFGSIVPLAELSEASS